MGGAHARLPWHGRTTQCHDARFALERKLCNHSYGHKGYQCHIGTIKLQIAVWSSIHARLCGTLMLRAAHLGLNLRNLVFMGRNKTKRHRHNSLPTAAFAVPGAAERHQLPFSWRCLVSAS